MTARTILLNPGPVTLSDRVRQALTAEDECHREPQFARLTLEIRDRLLAVYPQSQAAYEAVLLSGSGTTAVESMLSSLLPATGKTLVIVNGHYGQRILAILQAHNKPHVAVEHDWLAPLDLARIEHTLAADRDIRYVVAVHNETTSGRLNDLDAVARLCRKFDCALLLDAVSSFGGERIDFESWNLDAVALTANKCLHAVPGVAVVIGASRCSRSGRRPPGGCAWICSAINASSKPATGRSRRRCRLVSPCARRFVSWRKPEAGWRARRTIASGPSASVRCSPSWARRCSCRPTISAP